MAEALSRRSAAPGIGRRRRLWWLDLLLLAAALGEIAAAFFSGEGTQAISAPLPPRPSAVVVAAPAPSPARAETTQPAEPTQEASKPPASTEEPAPSAATAPAAVDPPPETGGSGTTEPAASAPPLEHHAAPAALDENAAAAEAYRAGLRFAQARNYVSALPLLRAAAAQANTDAQFMLGLLSEEGAGVPRSTPDAYAWYSLAASGGDADGAKAAERVAHSLPGRALAAAQLRASVLASQRQMPPAVTSAQASSASPLPPTTPDALR